MPRKDETKTPQKKIDQFIKRHIDGRESVATLAKEYGVSRAAAYLWLGKYRKQVIEQGMRGGMSKSAIEKSEKMTLAAKVKALEIENTKLRNKLVAMMIKAGEL